MNIKHENNIKICTLSSLFVMRVHSNIHNTIIHKYYTREEITKKWRECGNNKAKNSKNWNGSKSNEQKKIERELFRVWKCEVSQKTDFTSKVRFTYALHLIYSAGYTEY